MQRWPPTTAPCASRQAPAADTDARRWGLAAAPAERRTTAKTSMSPRGLVSAGWPGQGARGAQLCEGALTRRHLGRASPLWVRSCTSRSRPPIWKRAPGVAVVRNRGRRAVSRPWM